MYTEPPVQYVSGALFGVKGPGRECDRSSLMVSRYNASFPPYTFLACTETTLPYSYVRTQASNLHSVSTIFLYFVVSIVKFMVFEKLCCW